MLKLWTVVWKSCESILKTVLQVLLAAYRTVGTTHLGGSCRFEPSCSAYALEAIHTHKTHTALWLITKRICKCRPGGPYGYDPVPPLGANIHATKE
ncbi:MAG: membrane protein insertion efficiency factor YidD [Pseudobdellovibrionaceae bacterium]